MARVFQTVSKLALVAACMVAFSSTNLGCASNRAAKGGCATKNCDKPCAKPCDKPCDKPCPKSGQQTADKGCPHGCAKPCCKKS